MKFLWTTIHVQDLEAMMESLSAKSIPVESGPIETPTSRFFTIKDPNGIGIQFFQRK